MNPVRRSATRAHGIDHAPLRWSLLYVACELSDPRAADFLLRTAVEPLPAPAGHTGRTERRAAELYVRVLAVEALEVIARRHPSVAGHLVRLIASRPDPGVLVEAVRAAERLGLSARVREALR